MKQIGLFVTCLVDAMRPSVGFATLDLLERCGFSVVVPSVQTCCGQPAWNSGDHPATLALATKWLHEFEQFDHVVVPSGSCAGMIKTHYLQVLENHPDLKMRASVLVERVYELTQFLTEVVGVDNISSLGANELNMQVTYHDSCSGLRELGIYNQPRQLIAQLKQVSLVEMQDSKQCCGFGGTFSVKYGEISSAICHEKCQNISATGAQAVVLGDVGCMLNIQGKLEQESKPVQVLHIAELLAGQMGSKQG